MKLRIQLSGDYGLAPNFHFEGGILNKTNDYRLDSRNRIKILLLCFRISGAFKFNIVRSIRHLSRHWLHRNLLCKFLLWLKNRTPKWQQPASKYIYILTYSSKISFRVFSYDPRGRKFVIITVTMESRTSRFYIEYETLLANKLCFLYILLAWA